MTAVDNNDTLCACFYVLYLLRVEFSVLVKLSRKITGVDLPPLFGKCSWLPSSSAVACSSWSSSSDNVFPK